MLIAHLSDPHMSAEGELYKGLVDANALFDRAVDTVLALRPQPDVVIIGGDLVDDGTDAEYETVRNALSRFSQPVFVIPGNHDERCPFRRCFDGAPYLSASGPLHFDTGSEWPVRILGLDVTVPGKHHGEFDAGAAQWLEARLTAGDRRPTMILMHQPPVDSGMAYIDAYKCFGGERLSEIVARHPEIERVLCGHIHRFMQQTFGGRMLVTCPSTATAIALRLNKDATPASYAEPPAFLLHHWRQEAGLTTHWVPVGAFGEPLGFI